MVCYLMRLMFQTVTSGEACAVYGRISDPNLENLDETSFNTHRKYGRMLLFFTVATVILIEIGVIVSGNAQWDIFFFIHLVFAIPYLKITGVSKYHFKRPENPPPQTLGLCLPVMFHRHHLHRHLLLKEVARKTGAVSETVLQTKDRNKILFF